MWYITYVISLCYTHERITENYWITFFLLVILFIVRLQDKMYLWDVYECACIV